MGCNGSPAPHPESPNPIAAANSRSRVTKLCIGTVLVVGALVGCYLLLNPKKAVVESSLPDLASLNEDPDQPVFPTNPGYLGPASCAPCHAARVADFLK